MMTSGQARTDEEKYKEKYKIQANEVLNAVSVRAELASATNQGDYIKDDLLYCGKCHTAKQCVIAFGGIKRTVYCSCECEQQADGEEIMKLKNEQETARRRRNREIAFKRLKGLEEQTFENDQHKNPSLSDAGKKYVENFEQYRSEGKGLLMYGTRGNGKTYVASSIANALLDKGYSVLVTTLTNIEADLSSCEDKGEYYDSLNNYTLLVIDDFGAERQTSYMQEITYNVINNRYVKKLPLILTSNITNEQLRNPANIEQERVYSRLFEMCHPLCSKGDDLRKIKARADYIRMKNELGM